VSIWDQEGTTERIVARYEAGDRPADIARDYGVTRNTINAKLDRIGALRRRGPSAPRHYVQKARAPKPPKAVAAPEPRSDGLRAPAVKRDLLTANAVNFRKPKDELRPQARAFGETRVPPVLRLAGNTQVFEQSVAQEPHVVVGAKAWAPLPGLRPVPFVERRGMQCRWPVTGPDDGHHACGGPAPDGPYCSTHAERSRSKDNRILKPSAYARSLRRYA
jgi:hypothetical protein